MRFCTEPEERIITSEKQRGYLPNANYYIILIGKEIAESKAGLK